MNVVQVCVCGHAECIDIVCDELRCLLRWLHIQNSQPYCLYYPAQTEVQSFDKLGTGMGSAVMTTESTVLQQVQGAASGRVDLRHLLVTQALLPCSHAYTLRTRLPTLFDPRGDCSSPCATFLAAAADGSL